MPENKKFWKFCNQAGNKVELLLYGDISQTSWWGDEVTPKQFAEELAGLGALDEITVRINSGGDVFAAQAIGNQPQGTARADKCLVTGIAQAIKCIDNSLRRMDCIEVLIGHIVGIERRQRAVHVKKEHGGIGARINHMGSFRG